jgi:ligand-binding sensor domain-containing protein
LCRFYPSGGASPSKPRTIDAKESNTNAKATSVVYRPDEGQRASAIKTIYEDQSGTLWCGTCQGLYQVEQTNRQVHFYLIDIGIPIEEEKSYVVRSLLEDKKKALWIATDNGLYRLFGEGRVEHFSRKHGLLSDKLMGIIEDREGNCGLATGSADFARSFLSPM